MLLSDFKFFSVRAIKIEPKLKIKYGEVSKDAISETLSQKISQKITGKDTRSNYSQPITLFVVFVC